MASSPPQQNQSRYVVFTSSEELQIAVDIYLENDDRAVAMVQTFGPLPDWNVSLVTNFGNLFSARRNPLASEFNADVSAWDISASTHMYNMFQFASRFNGNLSQWRVDQVQQFNGMFEGALSFQGIGLDSWDVSSGVSFMAMFAETPSLSSTLDLRGWNLSKANTTESMFQNSSFGAKTPYNDVCAWREQLSPDVDTIAMFMDSACPQAQLETNLDPFSMADFCIECPATQNIWDFDEAITSAQTPEPTAEETIITVVEVSDPDDEITSAQTLDPSELHEQDGNDETAAEAPTTTPGADDSGSSNAGRPNILLLVTDQQRFDALRLVQDELWYYSNVTKIETPNLDKLATSGAFFRHAYCQCPVCAPARATLRTGCTLERTGIQTNDLISAHEYLKSDYFTKRIESAVSLDTILGKAGYVSEYYGKWHLPDVWWGPVRNNNFDYAKGISTFSTSSVGATTKSFLDHHEGLGHITRNMSEGMQLDSKSYRNKLLRRCD
jgi:Sulfatase/Mycoplasma protein of unknown function, DUF285